MSQREADGLVLLRISGADPPIYFVKEQHMPANWDRGTYEYHFDEAACPSDIIGAEEVFEGEDVDPHGVFEFVQVVPKPDDWPFVGTVDINRYRNLFSEWPAPAEAPATAKPTL